METLIMGWLQDPKNLAWISSVILASSLVWKFVESNGPKIRRASKITGKVLELVNGILDAADDKVISKEEVELIMKYISDLQGVLK